ncbi:MAG: lysophospholipase [Nanoarchaeota archaeon]|nr:lysophospholipase [Nanoarchaeota archaeon]
MREIQLTSEDNIKIALNYYAKSGRDSILIVCPGCFMCKDAKPFLNMAEDFFEYFDVIVMDFRGHGKSGGLFTFSAKEHLDLKAVVDYAKKKYAKIILLGFSLGAATAIIYTTKYKGIYGIIAVSTPTDFEKIENHFFKKDAVIPAMKKFEFGKSPTLRPGNIALKKIKPIDVVSGISPAPVLFLSGRKDPIIHHWHAEKLFERAREPKKLTVFQDGLHAEELYRKSKRKFIDTCMEWYQDINQGR